MNLRQPQGPLDEASREDGDPFFTGVNERLAPQQLPPGLGAFGRNQRFREGRAQTRDGIIILPWMRGLDGLTPFNSPLAGAVFRDPVNPGEWILIVDLDGIWKTQPNNLASAVPVPAGTTFTATSVARFVQCMGVLILLRGPDLAPLVCTDLDIGFREIQQTEAGTGTQTIPNSSFGIYYSNRLFLISGQDTVSQSDIGDYTRYVDVVDTFTINEGEDDALVVIKPFGADSLVMGKQRRIWKVVGVYGDLSNASGPFNVTQEYGVSGPDAMVEYDSVLYWWTGHELAAARLTETDEQQAQTIELSENLIKSFGRMNARYSDRVQLQTWRKKLFVIFPADEAWMLGEELLVGEVYDGSSNFVVTGLTVGQKYVLEFGANEVSVLMAWTSGAIEYGSGLVFTAEFTQFVLTAASPVAVTASLKAVLHEGVPNVAAVYDLVTGQWCGVDESDALMVRQTFKFDFHGREQLAFISHDGLLRAFEAGFEDEVLTNPATWGSELTSGNYNGAGASTVSGLTIGTRYRYVQGVNDTACAVNANIVLSDDGVFLATATSVTLTGTALAAVTASVKEVLGTIEALPIESSFWTRGYPCADLDGKRYAAFKALLSTFDPSYSLLTAVNGVNNESSQRTDITLSRTQYFQEGTADYDPENVNDDAEARGRKDYSVVLPENGVELNSGVVLDRHQDVTERVTVDERGDWLQLRFENARGHCEVRGVLVEALERDKPGGLMGQ